MDPHAIFLLPLVAFSLALTSLHMLGCTSPWTNPSSSSRNHKNEMTRCNQFEPKINTKKNTHGFGGFDLFSC